jgi:hypothetical protein
MPVARRALFRTPKRCALLPTFRHFLSFLIISGSHFLFISGVLAGCWAAYVRDGSLGQHLTECLYSLALGSAMKWCFWHLWQLLD